MSVYKAGMYAVKIANKPIEAIPVLGSMYMDGIEKITSMGEEELKKAQRQKLAWSLNELQKKECRRI